MCSSDLLALGLLAIAAGVGAGAVVALLPLAELDLPVVGAGWRASLLISSVALAATSLPARIADNPCATSFFRLFSFIRFVLVLPCLVQAR